MADLLSLVRILLAVPVFIYALQHQWKVAFVLLMIAWATDAVDGKLAEKFGSWSAGVEQDADGIADSALAFSSSVALAIALDGSAAKIAWTLVVLSALSACWMIFTTEIQGRKEDNRVIAFNMIVFHGGFQVVAVPVWFVALAYGSNAALGLLMVMAVVGLLQQNKVNAWRQGGFKPKTRPGA